MYLEAFSQHFSPITDTRQTAKVTYPLHDVLFITLCGVIAGAEGWADIHFYAEGHQEWFKKHGFLVDGIPVDDTIARIISRIDPEQFSECFVGWMQSVYELSQGEVIAIDGKTLRGSYTRDDRQATIHMVNAFACANKVVLGQVKTDEKSNEITAIPELVRLLDIGGSLVSIDAMGCQKDIANTILDGEGDYLFTLKGNQSALHDAVKDAFAEVREAPLGEFKIEKNRGRVEARAYYTQPADALAKAFPDWPELRTLGMSISYRQVKDKTPELTYRYHISSAILTEQQLAHAVRNHWAIENNLHWVLDVSLREDDCQVYHNHGAENLATLRQISLNMLRAEPSKGSIPSKRKKAWMKPDYLETVLEAGLTAMFKN